MTDSFRSTRDAKFHRALLELRIVRIDTSAPTRIDLAGGTIDIWPLYLLHEGAQTINVAISLRAEAQVEDREDGRIVLHSEDTGQHVEFADWSALRNTRHLRLLGLLVHWFLRGARGDKASGGLTLTTRCESPAGAGIAGSSALAVAVCAALARWTGQSDNPERLLQLAANIEAQTIRVPTGLQDYRPAMYGGICALELGVAGVRRVPLDVEARDLEQRLVLCYTGEPRNSGTNNWDIMKRHLDGDSHIYDCFERIRDTASVMRDALERGDWGAVGQAIAEEWENRMRLAPGVTTPRINDLIDRSRQAGALAAKVCGAGGGGCLFCFTDPARRGAVEAALHAGGARLLPFTIEARGLLHG